MFIEVTTSKGDKNLINIAHIRTITPLQNGGCSIYLVSFNYSSSDIILVVKETYQFIKNKIGSVVLS